MKMKEKVTAIARISAKKLNRAKALADGLKQVMKIIDIVSATIVPIIVEEPENKLAAEGEIKN